MKPSYALLTFCLLAVVGIVATTVLIVGETRTRAVEGAQREVQNLSALFLEQTERAMQSVELQLRGTRDRIKDGRRSGYLMQTRDLHTLFRARIDGVPQIRSLFMADREGKLTVTSLEFPAPDVGVADREYFTFHRDNATPDFFLGEPTRSRLDGEWSFQMSIGMTTTDDRKFDGIISASLSPAYFEDLYKTIALGPGSEISLYLRDGTLLARYPGNPEDMGKSFISNPVFKALGAQLGGGVRQTLLTTEAADRQIVSFGETRAFPLVVATAVSERTVLAAWRRQSVIIASGAAGMIIALSIAAFALWRELKRDEMLTAALRDSESRLNGVIGSAMDAIITVDQDGRIVLFNPAAERMFCCPSAQALGASLDRFLPERFRDGHAHLVRRFGETGVSSRAMGADIDIRARRLTGEEFPVDISISQLEIRGQKLYTAIVRDITARREAEQQLRRSHRQLRELSASLQAVREEERTRIARELHDELGQHLTGLKMDLSWMRPRLRDDQTALSTKIDGMKSLIDSTVSSMRRIASELRPLVLDDLGLSAAVEWLVQDFIKRTGIEVRMDLDAISADLDNALATGVFRIIQESLTNVARHSGAGVVDIALRRAEGILILEVRDDGRGISADKQEKRTHGLVGMRERAYMFGGQMNIDSAPGEGTSIQVTIPVAVAPLQEQNP